MAIAAIVLALIGIGATAFVGRLVHRKTTKLLKEIDTLLKRINIIQTARSTPEELRNLKRLIEDIEKHGVKRGTLAQTPDGKWKIDWTPMDETIL